MELHAFWQNVGSTTPNLSILLAPVRFRQYSKLKIQTMSEDLCEVAEAFTNADGNLLDIRLSFFRRRLYLNVAEITNSGSPLPRLVGFIDRTTIRMSRKKHKMSIKEFYKRPPTHRIHHPLDHNNSRWFNPGVVRPRSWMKTRPHSSSAQQLRTEVWKDFAHRWWAILSVPWLRLPHASIYAGNFQHIYNYNRWTHIKYWYVFPTCLGWMKL